MKVDDRRSFNRVVFNTTATLHVFKKKYDCEIIDLSIQGVFLRLLEQVDIEIGGNYQLDIKLGEIDAMISMEIELMHQDDLDLGFMCVQIDLESITHLRRLVELNLGDSLLLERNFENLLDDNR